MASLVKREGKSRFFYACYRVPITRNNGEQGWKQIMRCTKQEDRGKALRVALQLEDEALREVGANEGSSKMIMSLLREAGEKAAQKRLTLELGREFLRRLIELSTGEHLRVWSIRDWLNEWLTQKTKNAKPATQARYQHSISAFLTHIGETADMPIEHLNVQHLREFRDKLHDEGRAAKTANGYTKDVGMALHAAVKQRILQYSPASNLEALPEDDSVQREPFSLDEVKKLVKAASSQDWKGVILLGAFGGLRIGDAATIKVDSVDQKNHIISLKRTPFQKNQGLRASQHSVI
ncbi:MAG: phage integrase SAM-like domain-containing protein [Verrucomicrobia bacterium]|nr:phage integrase SAM-like domain-containing protein [Verrucomicrobiota bacterium]